jgi:hypothetical protein
MYSPLLMADLVEARYAARLADAQHRRDVAQATCATAHRWLSRWAR